MLDRLQEKYSLFWILQIGGWGAFAVAMALSRMGVYPLWYMVINKTILTILGLLVTLGMRSVYRRLWRQHPSLIRIIVVSVVCSYGVALIWRAKLSMALAAKAQATLGRVPPTRLVKPAVGGAYPLPREEMVWQLQFFGVDA